MKPSPHGPFPYKPINRRPNFRFPNGARVAVWVIPNIEFFSLLDRIPANAGGGPHVPDIPNWALRDYGNRIGVFRMMEVMKRYGMRGTVALNSNVCLHHPEIIDDAMALGWEFMGHNETNTHRLNEVEPGEDAQIIRRTVETIRRHTGVAPRGWLGAGLQETWQTLDQLADNGISYVADWVNDDQPYRMTLEDGRSIMSVPYSMEINDKPAFEKYHLTPDEFVAMTKRQFDVFYREGETKARVLGMAVHPYIIGVAHRIGALDAVLDYIAGHDDVWLATGAEIADAGGGAVGD